MTTTFCRDYDRFDPDAYLQMFYSSISGHVEESCEKDLLMLLHEIFSSENIKGKQLLEIGTGPTIHSVISASRYFENIYLSDFQLSNRECLLKWWNGTNTHDFSPFFRFIKELEADGIGEEVFGTAYMKADEVKRAIRESGMEIKTWKLVAERSTVQGEVSDFRSVYVMAGVKLE